VLNLEQGGREMLLTLDLRQSVSGGPAVVYCMMKERKQDKKEEQRQ
jgi:hypothetical protein